MHVANVRTVVGAPRRDLVVAVSELAGLGVPQNHEASARHPQTGARLQLFGEGWQRRDGR